MTKKDYLMEFNNLLNDDQDFYNQWGYKNKTKQLNSFNEWLCNVCNFKQKMKG